MKIEIKLNIRYMVY